MATTISVSLDDAVYSRLQDQLEGYGDNRSALVQEAIEQMLDDKTAHAAHD